MKKFLILGALVVTFSRAFSQEPLYQYYNDQIQKHFYTTNFNEYRNGRDGWRFEDVACRVYGSDNGQRGVVPFYQFYDPRTKDHYYTIRTGWRSLNPSYGMEKVACYIFKDQAPGTIPLYEYFNQINKDHFFSTKEYEMGPGHPGVVFNKVAGYVFPK